MPVALTDIGHRFGDGPWLFRKISARIDEGEVCALVGPSGSGKSTLLSIIAGWAEPAEGRIDNDGGPVSWVLQNPHGSAHRSARDHVALPFLAQGLSTREADERASRLLDDFGIGAVGDRPFSTLSGGEAQRLLLARAIARSPKVLLVDEPTAQLDQNTAHQVATSLSALRSRGIAVIIATHDHSVRDQCSAVIDLGDYAPGTSSGEPMDEGAPLSKGER